MEASNKTQAVHLAVCTEMCFALINKLITYLFLIAMMNTILQFQCLL
jgi:hypothetical protein